MAFAWRTVIPQLAAIPASSRTRLITRTHSEVSDENVTQTSKMPYMKGDHAILMSKTLRLCRIRSRSFRSWERDRCRERDERRMTYRSTT